MPLGLPVHSGNSTLFTKSISIAMLSLIPDKFYYPLHQSEGSDFVNPCERSGLVEIHLLSVYGLSSWGFDSDFTAFCVTTAQYRIWSIKMSLFGLILQMWCFFASWWHSLCAIWVQQQNFLIIVNYHGFCSLDCHINSSGCLEVCMYTLPEISAEI